MFKKIKRNFGFWGGLLAGMAFAVPLWGAEGELKNHAADLNLPEVVARINKAEISSDFIKFKINSFLTAMKRQAGGRPMGLNKVKKIEIARDIIDKEVVRELMYQAAKAADIKVEAGSLDQEMANLMKAMGGEEKFKKSLAQRSINSETIKRDLEMEFLIRELIQKQIAGNIKVADAEVKAFYENNMERFKRPDSFHTRHILIPHFSREDLRTIGKDEMGEKQKELSEQSKKKAEEILAEIRGGANFETLAEKHSKDEESAAKGGDLGFMYKGIFPQEFDKAVEKLNPQQVSDVVTTVAGHHIIQLIETRPADTAPFADVKEGIQKFIFMQNGRKNLEHYVEKLRKRAAVEVLY